MSVFTTKDLMVAPEGRVFIEVDLGQIEVRVLAMLSGCKKMIDELNDPEFDPHCKSGAMASGCTYKQFYDAYKEKQQWAIDARRAGKTISFEKQYGASDDNIAKRNNIPLTTVKTFSSAYARDYPEVIQFHKSNMENVIDNEGVLQLYGYPRVWKFKLTQYGNYSKTQVMNYPVQGVAYDVLKLAWIYPMSPEIWKHRQVHDSILYSIPNCDTVQENELYKEIMCNFDTLQARVSERIHCPVSLPYDVKIGYNLAFSEE